MKRFTLALVATGMVVALTSEYAVAQHGHRPNCPKGQVQPKQTHTHPGQHKVLPKYGPNVYKPVTPPVRPPVPPRVGGSTGGVGFTGFGGGVVTNNAYMGFNPITQRWSIAFNTPGMDGGSILLRAGYTQIYGPTTWTAAVGYLRSIGAPGW